MKTVIAENKGHAENFAKALGIETGGNKGYFEGEEYTLTWAHGHLFETVNADYYDKKYKKWNLEDLPILPDLMATRLVASKARQFKVIKDLVKQSSLVINAGDCGQEGEYIIRLILEHANYKGEVKRLWWDADTDRAIKAAFCNLRQPEEFEQLYQSAKLRSEIDWKTGINWTRAFTIKFAREGEKAINAGRVTTPTLNAIVERYLANKNFKKETFKVLTFESEGFKFSSERLEDVKKAETAKTFTILESEKEEKSDKPFKLLKIGSLQIEANKLFGFSSDQTEKIGQKLKDKGLITYHRTDFDGLPEEYDEGLIKEIFENNGVDLEIDKKNKRIFDDKKVGDHHAIIPTEEKKGTIEDKDQEKIYDLIVKRFLQAFYPDLKKTVYNVTGVTDTDIEAKGSITVINEKGFKEIYNFKDPDKETEEEIESKSITLPEKGSAFEITPDIKERETKPPALYTHASLTTFMENAGRSIDEKLTNGIGTAATRGKIIEKLKDVGFVIYKKRQIIPTDRGIRVIQLIPSDMIKKPHLTVKLERYFDEIKKGCDVEELRQRFQKGFEKQFSEIKAMKAAEDKEQKTKFNCPKCGEPLFVGRYGLVCRAKNDDDNYHFTLPFEMFHKKFTQKDFEDLFALKKTKVFEGLYKEKGKEFRACFYLDQAQDFKLVLDPERAKIKDSCPKCGKETLKLGKNGLYCNSDCEGEYKFSLSNSLLGVSLSDQEIIEVLQGNKTKVYTFKGKKSFKARLTFDRDKFSYGFMFEDKKNRKN